MTYQFAREREDYSDFATGRVLRSAPGRTAFPVRLAEEIFQRALALLAGPEGRRASENPARRLVLYDPVCGSGALLVTLALLHGTEIAAAMGSDADPEALRLAAENVALLTLPGLEARIEALTALQRQFGKESHAAAITSAHRLRRLLVDPPVTTALFQADATDPTQVRDAIRGASARLDSGGRRVDLVIADVPHGARSAWTGARTETAVPLDLLLEALRPVLAPSAVVAIASDKAQRPHHAAYRRRVWFQVGKRRIELLSLLG